MIELLAKVENYADCRVSHPSGQPALRNGHALPPDVAEFYSLCGGIVLFESAPFSLTIVAPSEFEPSNLVITGTALYHDPSDDWYVIAKSGSDQLVSIDLSPERLGRCYDSFWDRHAVAGSSPVVARSLEELIVCALQSEGKTLFWLQPQFVSLGDAYD